MTKRSSLIWIVLFASVILVPTLCLLWFMEQAVTNERLAVQQQLTTLYSNRIDEFDWSLNRFFISTEEGSGTVHQLCSNAMEIPTAGSVIAKGDSLLYPKGKLKRAGVKTIPTGVSRSRQLWRLEYTEKKYRAAAEEYRKIADSLANSSGRINALLGTARCYKKEGDTTEAIKTYEYLISSVGFSDSTEKVGNGIIALAKLYVLRRDQNDNQRLVELLEDVQWDVSTDMRTFMIHNQLAIAKSAEYLSSKVVNSLVNYLEKALQFEQLSNKYKNVLRDSLISGNENLFSIDSLYFSCEMRDSLSIVRIFSARELTLLLNKQVELFNDPNLTFQLVDLTGTVIDGDEMNASSSIYSLSLSEYGYGDLIMEFYLKDSGLFSNHIKNRAALYIWIGILTILFIVITGTATTYLYIHHSNLNKLKNNFLSTVTHELKTPIASCRILVETLIDKKVTEPSKVREYHELIAQENLRLGRLVDTFLTFSRMERNNQSFQKESVVVSDLLSVAITSLSVKLNRSNCEFSYKSPQNAPVLLCNGDAIITVVTNLLDNALKYSGADKRISLRCHWDESQFQIIVSDNGIGVAKSEQKKIFQKFYQVDQKLSRSVEGCGLGLSIVNYIVKAHKGEVTLISEENSGSTFTVSLPIHKEKS